MLKYSLAVIVAIVFALFYYYRTKPELSAAKRWSLIILRIISTSLVILFLMTPIIYYIRKYKQKPVVIFLNDSSQSMTNQQDTQSKKAALDPSYRVLLQSYQDQGYVTKEYSFADGLKGKSNTTFIIPSIEKAIAENSQSPITSLVLWSDGWYRDPDLNLIKNLEIPVLAVADTVSQNQYDLEISNFRYNRKGYNKELNLFEADIKSIGYSGSASVLLYIDGKQCGAKTVSFKTDPIQTAVFDYRFSSTGLHKLEIRVSASGKDEVNLANNRYPGAIEILKDKEQIIIIADKPNWDGKFILDATRQNPRWQVQSYTLRNNILYQGEKPAEISTWDKVSVVVLINNGSLSMSANLANILKSRVNQGCGMLYFGQPLPELADILPLKSSNVKSVYQGLIRFLPAAGLYAAFQVAETDLSQIPPVDYYYQTLNPGAEMLATMDNSVGSPAIAIQKTAGGRVIGYACFNLWRWQMQSKSSAYQDFFSRQFQWLAGGDGSQFIAHYQPSYFQGESIEFRLAATNEIRQSAISLSPRLTIKDTGGKDVLSDFLVPKGDDYSLNLRLDKPGEYKFVIEDKATGKKTGGSFVVQNMNREERDLGYNLPLLNWIAGTTKGKLFTPTAAAAYRPIKANSSSKIEKKEFPLYRKWYMIGLFIMSFCLELFFRRRWGLL